MDGVRQNAGAVGGAIMEPAMGWYQHIVSEVESAPTTGAATGYMVLDQWQSQPVIRA